MVPEIVWFSSWSLLPIAFAISIFRYRLYEIDVIIRRTLVYAGVAVTLGALYLGAVVLLSTGFRSVVGWSDSVAVTLSTLAVALAFHPVRRRVQRLVDHRFYRSSYDATRTLDEFSTRLRQQIDLDALSDRAGGSGGIDTSARSGVTLASLRRSLSQVRPRGAKREHQRQREHHGGDQKGRLLAVGMPPQRHRSDRDSQRNPDRPGDQQLPAAGVAVRPDHERPRQTSPPRVARHPAQSPPQTPSHRATACPAPRTPRSQPHPE